MAQTALLSALIRQGNEENDIRIVCHTYDSFFELQCPKHLQRTEGRMETRPSDDFEMVRKAAKSLRDCLHGLTNLNESFASSHRIESNRPPNYPPSEGTDDNRHDVHLRM